MSIDIDPTSFNASVIGEVDGQVFSGFDADNASANRNAFNSASTTHNVLSEPTQVNSRRNSWRFGSVELCHFLVRERYKTMCWTDNLCAKKSRINGQIQFFVTKISASPASSDKAGHRDTIIQAGPITGIVFACLVLTITVVFLAFKCRRCVRRGHPVIPDSSSSPLSTQPFVPTAERMQLMAQIRQ